MIPAPSLLREYALVSRFDPALDKPAAPPECEPLTDEDPEAFEKRKAERDELAAKVNADWVRRFEIARDAGTWADLVKPGATATVFHVRQIPGVLWRRFIDFTSDARNGVGDYERAALMFRLGVVRIDGYAPGHKVEKVEHVDRDGNRTGLGSVLSEDVVNLLDAAAPMVVTEIGYAILARRIAPPPL